ncbi:MAG: SPOR domain-containing protein [Sphingomonas fennica]
MIPAPRAALLAALLAAAPAAAQDSIAEQPSAAMPAAATDPLSQARAAAARGDDAEALAHYLRILTRTPRDLTALTGAGRTALDLDDPESAIAFFARAEEVAPRDGRVKAGLGEAMVAQRNPVAALRFFREAVALGVPAADLGAARGLAYDLRGDGRRAQTDYRAALAAHDDPETVRRLALSQAMTGQREAALATLDPLLRRQDIPAWRARAFVYAVTGAPDEAEKAARQVMPRAQAEALSPYLARIAALKPADQAAAVHLGYLPAGATPVRTAANTPPAPAATDQLAAASALPVWRPAPTAPARTASAATGARRPASLPATATPAGGGSSPTPADRAPSSTADAFAPARPATTVLPAVTATSDTRTAPPATVSPTTDPRPAAEATVPVRTATSSPVAASGTPAALTSAGDETGSRSTAATPSPLASSTTATMPSRVASSTTATMPDAGPDAAASKAAIEIATASPATAAYPRTGPSTGSAAPSATAGLAAPTTGVATATPAGTPPAPARTAASAATVDRDTPSSAPPPPAATDPASRRKRTATASAADAGAARDGASGRGATDFGATPAKKDERRTAKAEPAPKKASAPKPPREPERHWVQVAGGANVADMPKAWAGLLKTHGPLLRSRQPWTMHYRFTNRLMVGPFADEDAAQEFVNRARKDGLPGFSVTSKAGETVTKMATR